MRPQHVLVCAEPSTAERLADVLRNRGFAVETVDHGDLALEVADHTEPSVVLAWSDLPGPGGPDLVRGLRAGTSSPLVAAVLRPDDTERASDFLDAGADGLLVDDGDLEFLAWAVDQVIQGGLVVAPVLARTLLGGAPGRLGPVEAEAATTNGSSAGHSHAPAESLGYEPGVDFTHLDVAEIVQQAAAEAGRGCPNVLVQVSTPPRLPAIGVPHALEAVVRILVEMACADSEPGSDVAVKAQRGDAGITVYFTDRGPGMDRKQVAQAMVSEGPTDHGPTHRLNVARGLVAVHGGILWAEPLPAGGQRVSFTIPEQPPILTGVELRGAMRALELLEELESPPRPEVTAEAEPAAEETLDLAAAVADAAALAEEPAPAPVAPEVEVEPTEPATSLADLFEVEPLAAALEEVVAQPEAEDEEKELAVLLEDEPEAGEVLPALAAETADEVEVVVSPEAEVEAPPVLDAEVELEDEEVLAPEPAPEPEDEDVLAAALAEPEPELEPVPEPEPEPEPLEPVALPEPEPVFEPPAAETFEQQPHEVEPVPMVPEPVPAASAAAEATERHADVQVMPDKKFIADPLHPATAILRSLAEDYDQKLDGQPGF